MNREGKPYIVTKETPVGLGIPFVQMRTLVDVHDSGRQGVTGQEGPLIGETDVPVDKKDRVKDTTANA